MHAGALRSKVNFALKELRQVFRIVFTNSLSGSIYLGDSHVWYLAKCFPSNPNSHVFLNAQGDIVFWIGPRLMHSVGMKGFKLNIFQKLTLFILRNRKILTLIVHVGEIDCRMHSNKLLEKPNVDLMVRRFLERLLDIRKSFRFQNLIVITPIPPSDFSRQNEEYPRNGSRHLRIETTARVTASILEMSENFGFNTLDAQKTLGIVGNTQITGALDQSLTLDGCHINAKGSEIVQERIISILNAK